MKWGTEEAKKSRAIELRSKKAKAFRDRGHFHRGKKTSSKLVPYPYRLLRDPLLKKSLLKLVLFHWAFQIFLLEVESNEKGQKNVFIYVKHLCTLMHEEQIITKCKKKIRAIWDWSKYPPFDSALSPLLLSHMRQKTEQKTCSGIDLLSSPLSHIINITKNNQESKRIPAENHICENNNFNSIH